MSAIEVIVLVLSLEGLLFVALGKAMTNVAPNRFVGIRYPATFADERVWRETHARYGPAFSRPGWLILGGGLAIVALPLADPVTLGAYLVLSLGSLGWFIWDSWRFAKRRLQYYRGLDATDTD
ncbi:MAG: SdpI family protein [Chloroflexi bacterium]|nr:SdpI family protein [Chloroflexota bacterium]MQC48337.1 SdpI family protein [Chloroflexota bacterium]